MTQHDEDRARALEGLRRMHILAEPNQNSERIYQGRLTETEWLTIHLALTQPAREAVDVATLRADSFYLKVGGKDGKPLPLSMKKREHCEGWNACLNYLTATGHLRQPGGETKQNSSGAYGGCASPYEGSEPVSNVGSPELRTDTASEGGETQPCPHPSRYDTGNCCGGKCSDTASV